MMKSILICAALLAGALSFASAQQPGRRPPLSPPAETSVTIAGKALTIKYSAPSVRGRKIFGEGGVISKDPDISRLAGRRERRNRLSHGCRSRHRRSRRAQRRLHALRPGEGPRGWELIINKQTGQWGLTYNAAQDLGRVKMTMSKPPALIETLKYTLSDQGGNKAKLQLEWENHIASVAITVK